MFYAIRHITRFRYSAPVHESVMELRMQPRSEGPQTLRSFQLVTSPRAQLHAYTDHLGNAVYHFNVLRAHEELRIEAQAVVECTPAVSPDAADMQEWERYNAFNLTGDHYDLLQPSRFAHGSPALEAFMVSHAVEKPAGDPLSALTALNRAIHNAFDYQSGVTEVHSPIDHALAEGRGVCQDFAHIMIAIARHWGVPARYVSGYLHHRQKDEHRSGEDATHAWVETYLPSLGWLGFDPTNNIATTDGHIRVAVGRDYADVPPTRGTFKGDAQSELAISVSVEPAQAPTRHEEFLRVAHPMKPQTASDAIHHQQQQQQ